LKENEDMNESEVTAVNMPYSQHQQQIISIEDDDFPSEDEKVGKKTSFVIK
jgi:hypothetical protein